jgi:hypothetical protein
MNPTGLVSVRNWSFSTPESGPEQALAGRWNPPCGAWRIGLPLGHRQDLDAPLGGTQVRFRASNRFPCQNEESLFPGARNLNRKLQVSHPVFPDGHWSN